MEIFKAFVHGIPSIKLSWEMGKWMFPLSFNFLNPIDVVVGFLPISHHFMFGDTEKVVVKPFSIINYDGYKRRPEMCGRFFHVKLTINHLSALSFPRIFSATAVFSVIVINREKHVEI